MKNIRAKHKNNAMFLELPTGEIFKIFEVLNTNIDFQNSKKITTYGVFLTPPGRCIFQSQSKSLLKKEFKKRYKVNARF